WDRGPAADEEQQRQSATGFAMDDPTDARARRAREVPASRTVAGFWGFISPRRRPRPHGLCLRARRMAGPQGLEPGLTAPRAPIVLGENVIELGRMHVHVPAESPS